MTRCSGPVPVAGEQLAAPELVDAAHQPGATARGCQRVGVGGVAAPVRAQVARRAGVGVDDAGRPVGGHEVRRRRPRRRVEREGAADAARKAALVADQRDALLRLGDRRRAGESEAVVGAREVAAAVVGADDAGARGHEHVVARERHHERQRRTHPPVGGMHPGAAAIAGHREARVGHGPVALRGAVDERCRARRRSRGRSASSTRRRRCACGTCGRRRRSRRPCRHRPRADPPRPAAARESCGPPSSCARRRSGAACASRRGR